MSQRSHTELERSTPQPSRHSIAPIATIAGALALTGAGLALIAWSRNYVIHDMPMTGALDGDLKTFKSRAGELAYYAHGHTKRGAAPLVFVHSINAAASSFEMKPLYDHYSRERRVYALDLPGYGFSERSDRAYSPELMRLAITEFIEHELKGGPADVVALSLGCEFVTLAAQAAPKLFRSLSFISPTGMSADNTDSRRNDGLHNFLRMSFWSRPLYDLLTSRPSMRFFLQQSQKRPVNRALVNYAYVTSHQPNAEWAPFHFLAGKLWTPTIFDSYDALSQPCLLIYGRDPFVRYDRVDALRAKPNWKVISFENAGTLTHWDDLSGVTRYVDKMVG
jgi:pimeloyl-ACP methyl ester carboxylesterase